MHPALRNSILLTALVIFCTMPGFINEIRAQTLVGLKVSPAVMYTRINNMPEYASVTTAGLSARLAGGLFVDIPLHAHYTFISTGLEYRPKVVKYSTSLSANAEIFENTHTLQYLEIPLSLVLTSDEFALDKRFYTELGLIGGILIHQEQKMPEVKFIEKFRPYDVTLLLGAGVQFQLGFRTAMKLGFSYRRGLVNIASVDILNSEAVIKTTALSLDLGLRY